MHAGKENENASHALQLISDGKMRGKEGKKEPAERKKTNTHSLFLPMQ